MPSPLHVVTGALGYSGRAVAERLFALGHRVRTLTNSPGRPNPFGAALEIRPLAFDDADALRDSLRAADTLINTYWVRFNHRLFTFDQAVRNTRILFAAARDAGVRRIVHVSILKPDEGRGLAYYEGKLALERSLQESGVSHAILRPGVLFGRGDILVNNIAWALRRFPVFGVFGDGHYALRPLHVDDLANVAADHALSDAPAIIDCVGPETFTYRDLVSTIARLIGVRRAIIPMPVWMAYAATRAAGPWVRDVVLTREEVEGLMRGLLSSEAPSAGPTRLTVWVAANAESLGRRYASELRRRRHRAHSYEAL